MTVMEVGVGSGAVITTAALLMARQGNNSSRFLGTDINPKAIACASRVAEANKVEIEFIETEFADSIIDLQVDVLIFNPPYVVTSEEELDDAQAKKGIEAAWAGGIQGTQVLLNFIPTIQRVLKKSGVLYLLLI